MFFVLTILAEVGGWMGTSFRVFHWTFTSGKPQNSDLKTLGKFSLAGYSFVLDDYTIIALTFLLTAEGHVLFLLFADFHCFHGVWPCSSDGPESMATLEPCVGLELGSQIFVSQTTIS